MNRSHTVSVVITTYNYGRFLKRSISSVLRQDFPADFREVLVVDDGSTDDTSQIVTQFGDQIRYVYQKNSGQAEAINRALQSVKGDIVAFLDSDDEWYPDKLKKTVQEFENPEVGMVQHVMDLRNNVAGSTFRLHDQLSSGSLGELSLTPAFKCMPTSALSFRMEVLKQFLPVPSVLKTGADWYFCVLVALVTKISVIEEPLGIYWVHGANAFSSNTTATSYRQQLLTIETVRERAKQLALSLGMKIPETFDAGLYSEYPTFCRMNLAWHEKSFSKIPSYYWKYLQKYAFQEYGWSLRLLRRSLRMAACGVIPPPIYRKLGFYSHG